MENAKPPQLRKCCWIGERSHVCFIDYKWGAETYRRSETFCGLQWISLLSAMSDDFSGYHGSVITLHLRKVPAQGNWEHKRGTDKLRSLCTKPQAILLPCRTHAALPQGSRNAEGF